MFGVPFPQPDAVAGALVERLRRSRLAWRQWVPPLAAKLLLLPACGLMLLGYTAAGMPVTLVVDVRPQAWRTHQATVEGLLQEAGLALIPEDAVSPPLTGELSPGCVVRVQRARTVNIEADGRQLEVITQPRPLAEVLTDAGILVGPGDEAQLDGQPCDLNASLPPSSGSLPGADTPPVDGAGQQPAIRQARPPTLHLVLQRASPVILAGDGAPAAFYTARATVGEALHGQGIPLYPEDRVTPGLESPITPGMAITIERAIPLTLQADGNAMSVRTRAHTVGEALAQAGIPLVGQDTCRPSADAPVTPGMTIQVIRVRQTIKIEQEPIPAETDWQPAAELPIDTRRVLQPGQPGLTKRRYRITWENGQEVSNVLEDEWVDRPPVAQVVRYGTHVTVQTADTPDGPIQYWRRFRVWATSYTAASAGKGQEHPRFGMTRSGAKAGFGVIAVDPRVIPLNSQVYVPGYGKAIAGDTGAGVVGRRIDLGYDDPAPPHWYQWVDLYMLAPPPPDRQIRYVLPE